MWQAVDEAAPGAQVGGRAAVQPTQNMKPQPPLGTAFANAVRRDPCHPELPSGCAPARSTLQEAFKAWFQEV